MIDALIPDGFANRQADDLKSKGEALVEGIKSLPDLPEAIKDKYQADIALADALQEAYDDGRADITILEESARIRAKADAEVAIMSAELATIAAGGAGAAIKAARLASKLDIDVPGGIKGAIEAGAEANRSIANDVQRFLADERGSIPLSRDALEAMRQTSRVRAKARRVLEDVVGPPPAGMQNPHAHHVLALKGNGPAQQALVAEGREILQKHGIDPDIGIENLTWAPNVKGQHIKENVEALVNDLKTADADPFVTQAQIADVLFNHGNRAKGIGQ